MKLWMPDRAYRHALLLHVMLLLGVVHTTSLSAQQHTTESRSPSTPNKDSTAQDLMSRTVTVDIEGLTVRRAVDLLATRAGVQVQYRHRLIDSLTKTVTLSVRDIPLRDALNQVLEGTQLQAIVVNKTLFAIVARPKAKASSVTPQCSARSRSSARRGSTNIRRRGITCSS